MSATAPPPVTDAELGAFFGPGALGLVPLYRRWAARPAALRWIDFSLSALILQFAWLYRRKMILPAGLAVALPTLGMMFLSHAGAILAVLAFILVPVAARPLYFVRAGRVIAAERGAGPADTLLPRLRAIGGTAPLGLLAGLLLALGNLGQFAVTIWAFARMPQLAIHIPTLHDGPVPFALVVGPALVWLLALGRLVRGRWPGGEALGQALTGFVSIGLVVALFGTGLLLVAVHFGAPGIVGLMPSSLPLQYPFGMAAVAFGYAATWEECARYLVIAGILATTAAARRPGGLVLAGMLAGLGHGLAENIHYALVDGGNPINLTGRAAATLPLQMGFGLTMGALLELARHAPDRPRAWALRLQALLVPWLMHGAYDFFAFTTEAPSWRISAERLGLAHGAFLLTLALVLAATFRLGWRALCAAGARPPAPSAWDRVFFLAMAAALLGGGLNYGLQELARLDPLPAPWLKPVMLLAGGAAYGWAGVFALAALAPRRAPG